MVNGTTHRRSEETQSTTRVEVNVYARHCPKRQLRAEYATETQPSIKQKIFRNNPKYRQLIEKKHTENGIDDGCQVNITQHSVQLSHPS